MIYLDNAATTLKKPPQVGEAILSALGSFGNSSRGTHEEALDAARVVFMTRQKIADMFGCSRADHVVFTCNITESLNIAVNGLINPGDHVISTDQEHNSVLRPLYRLEAEQGVELSFLPVDPKNGRLRYELLEGLFKPNTKAVVCNHSSNLTGNVTDLAYISKLAHSHGAILIVDAAQTAGTKPLNMEELGIDVLCFTGHKGLMGPQGTGGMCIREGIEIRPFKVGGTGVQSYSKTQPAELPTALEAGTMNGHGIAGLSAALDYIKEVGVENIEAHETALVKRFLEGVRDIEGIKIYGDFCSLDPSPAPEDAAIARLGHSGIVALNIGDIDSSELSDALSFEYGIATRPGAHCAPRLHEALGTNGQGAVRFSFAWFTTEEEVDEAVRALKEIASR